MFSERVDLSPGLRRRFSEASLDLSDNLKGNGGKLFWAPPRAPKLNDEQRAASRNKGEDSSGKNKYLTTEHFILRKHFRYASPDRYAEALTCVTRQKLGYFNLNCGYNSKGMKIYSILLNCTSIPHWLIPLY